MILRILVLAAMMAGAGCASPGNFPQLAQEEQATFNRCTRAIEPAIGCLGLRDISEVMCVTEGKKTYADQPGLTARQRWLAGNGCPASMVQPERYVGDVPASEAAPQVHGEAALGGAAAGAAARESSKAQVSK